MNCSKCKELISLYIDGMLDANKLKDMEDHIKKCDSCRSSIEEYKQMLDTLNYLDKNSLPEGFMDRLNERLSQEDTKNKLSIFPNKVIKWVGTVAAVVVLITSLNSLDIINLSSGLFRFNNNLKSDKCEESIPEQELHFHVAEDLSKDIAQTEDIRESADTGEVCKNDSTSSEEFSESVEGNGEVLLEDDIKYYIDIDVESADDLLNEIQKQLKPFEIKPCENDECMKADFIVKVLINNEQLMNKLNNIIEVCEYTKSFDQADFEYPAGIIIKINEIN